MLWWTLRSLGVEEWAVRVIQGMYANARSRVRVAGQLSEDFDVTVDVIVSNAADKSRRTSPLVFIFFNKF